MNKPIESDYSIKSLYRALQILDIFLEVKKPLPLEEICNLTKLPKSTAFRLVTNLVDTNYLVKTDKGYWLSLKFLQFGSLISNKLDIKNISAPYLKKLHDEFNETVHFAILNQDWRIVYLDKIVSTQAVSVMSSEIGGTAPFHCTSLGKAIAAFKPEAELRNKIQKYGLKKYTANTIIEENKFIQEMRAIRELGFAFDNGEHEESIRCVAAPVFDKNGHPVAAISVSGPKQRMEDPKKEYQIKHRLKDFSKEISEKLGWQGILDRTLAETVSGR